MTSDKPAHIQLRGDGLKNTEFDTAGERDAAEWILELWPETHNLSEIARRSDWSPSHIRSVFNEYFEPAEEPPETDGGGLARSKTGFRMDEDAVPEWIVEKVKEAYREGYQDGYDDGYAQGHKQSE